MAENYLQHAEHYFRVLSSLPPEEPRYSRPQNQQDGQQSQDNTSTHNDTNDMANEAPEEVIVNTSATALPSFITGVRDDNREPARVADQE